MARKITVSMFAALWCALGLISHAIAVAAADNPLQTLTIYGATGTTGDTDQYIEFSRDGGESWNPAYKYSGHPWGNTTGATLWLNCAPTGDACLNETVLYRVRFQVPSGFADPQLSLEIKADNSAHIFLNSAGIGSITTEGTISGSSGFNDALQAGMNELQIELIDAGGLAGLVFTFTIQVNAALPVSAVEAGGLSAPTFDSDPSPGEMTKGPVGVTIHYPDAAVVTEYSFDGDDWLPYESELSVESNGTVYARWEDADGNVSLIGSFVVANMDSTPPPEPVMTPSTANPTAGPVAVTLGDWGDAAVKEYRIDGGDWLEVPESSEVVMTANGTLEARGTDSLGNESAIALIHIDNISTDPDPLKVVYAAPDDSGTKLIVHFNRALDRSMWPNKQSFRLSGVAQPVESIAFASAYAVILEWTEPAADASSVLEVDAGAVTDRNGDPMLEWKTIPVQSRQHTIAVREQLLSAAGSSAGSPIRIGDVAGYLQESSADVTGDEAFDRTDMSFLLMQVDPSVVALPASDR